MMTQEIQETPREGHLSFLSNPNQMPQQKAGRGGPPWEGPLMPPGVAPWVRREIRKRPDLMARKALTKNELNLLVSEFEAQQAFEQWKRRKASPASWSASPQPTEPTRTMEGAETMPQHETSILDDLDGGMAPEKREQVLQIVAREASHKTTAQRVAMLVQGLPRRSAWGDPAAEQEIYQAVHERLISEEWLRECLSRVVPRMGRAPSARKCAQFLMILAAADGVASLTPPLHTPSDFVHKNALLVGDEEDNTLDVNVVGEGGSVWFQLLQRAAEGEVEAFEELAGRVGRSPAELGTLFRRSAAKWTTWCKEQEAASEQKAASEEEVDESGEEEATDGPFNRTITTDSVSE